MGKREDYIKQILLGYETPVDIPSTWDDLEKLLDTPAKKKKPIWLWFLFAAMLITIGVSAFFLIPSKVDSPIASSAETNNTQTNNETLSLDKDNQINETLNTAISANSDDLAIVTEKHKVKQALNERINEVIVSGGNTENINLRLSQNAESKILDSYAENGTNVQLKDDVMTPIISYNSDLSVISKTDF